MEQQKTKIKLNLSAYQWYSNAILTKLFEPEELKSKSIETVLEQISKEDLIKSDAHIRINDIFGSKCGYGVAVKTEEDGKVLYIPISKKELVLKYQKNNEINLEIIAYQGI